MDITSDLCLELSSLFAEFDPTEFVKMADSNSGKKYHKGRVITAGYVKPKHRRAEGPITGKRKLSRYGKKQVKGLDGHAVQYMTRSRALQKLQLTLPEFRCV